MMEDDRWRQRAKHSEEGRLRQSFRRAEERWKMQKTWIKATVFSAVVLVVVLALSGGLTDWRDEQTFAAERVLDPDRAYLPAPEPQPLDPLLKEGENIRFPTQYAGKTETLSVEQSDLHRGFLILVNYNHVLPEDYLPENLAFSNQLTDASDPSGFSVSRDGIEIDRTVGEKLLVMACKAWENDGVGGFLLVSAYRDFTYQSYLHQRKIQEYRAIGYSVADAGNAAAFWVARPRESEHHTGLAMDLPSRSHPDLQTSYARNPNGLWLAENSWRYGFIVRYPEDKSGTTGIGFEPWHIRYVGHPHSDLIQLKGWCLEEYLEFLASEGGYTFRDGDGVIWQVDYQQPDGGAVKVPADLPYSISGDGSRGYIVTAAYGE